MSDLATAAQSAARNVAVPGLLVLRSPRVSKPSSGCCSPRAPGYVGHELMVAERGRLSACSPRATTRRCSCATPDGIELLSNICRHRQAIMLQRPRQRAQHRLPAPPLDLRSEGRAPRRAALRRQPVPQPAAARRFRTGTACCSTASATSRATSPALGVKHFDFSGYVLDRVEIARVQLQLEDVHRGLSRGLPRRAVPSRASASSSRATT